MNCIKNIWILGLVILFVSCEPSFDEFAPSKGEADFSSFVAIGDSYTAGYTDGALGAEGQKYSFVNIMAQQFKTVGGGEFKQPLTAEGKSVGTTTIDAQGNKNGFFKLSVTASTASGLKPVPTAGDMSIFTTSVALQSPFNNMGVPGAKSIHLVTPGFGNPAAGQGKFNPFFTRMASNPVSTTVLGDALLTEPTFFSLWIGGNDVLWYALAGGEAVNGGFGSDDITPLDNFNGAIDLILNSLSTGGATKGVMANIPDINALPYFTTVPYNALKLDQTSADALNAGYAQYNLAANAASLPAIVFVAGYNPFVIADPEYALGFRQIKSTEKVLLSLPTDKISGTEKWGSMTPIPISYILDESELANIRTTTAAFNTSLKAKADAKGLAFVDIFALMNEIVLGKQFDGFKYSSTFVSGGMFSLDGIHATNRGSAIIANEFIKAINAKYGANVPVVNINDYKTVIFPEKPQQ